MASKMKNIDPKKTSLFYSEDGFHPKKLHGLSEEPNPLKICVEKYSIVFILKNLSYKRVWFLLETMKFFFWMKTIFRVKK